MAGVGESAHFCGYAGGKGGGGGGEALRKCLNRGCREV